ncbi:MAG TPA: hypothetical protein VM345_14025 [Acidimicrobiales bacterium]|nr:hypothetical protein [Acidimicrobiales bacterium]
MSTRVTDRLVDKIGWDDRHRALASHPMFRQCSRSEIRWLVRRGDFVHVEAGERLWAKDRAAHWLLVLFTGALDLREGRRVRHVTAPTQVGAELILAFAPTPATATTSTGVDAFALNRGHLLGIAHLRSIRAGLGLPVDDASYLEWVRAMRAQADAAWRRVQVRRGPDIKSNVFPSSFRVYTRTETGQLTRLVIGPQVARTRTPPPPPARLSRRAVTAIALTFVSVAATFGLTYRPPLAIARPGVAIDVTRDITVDGVATGEVNGRYLLLPVEYDRPPLLLLAWQMMHGADPLRWADDAELRAAREEHARSKTAAVSAALAVAGVDNERVRVDIRSRGLTGGSAALVYALVLADMLDAKDNARGRTIAATGALDEAGRIWPVHHTRLKATSASRGGADLLIVPSGLDAHNFRAVLTATSLGEALELLSRAPS